MFSILIHNDICFSKSQLNLLCRFLSQQLEYLKGVFGWFKVIKGINAHRTINVCAYSKSLCNHLCVHVAKIDQCSNREMDLILLTNVGGNIAPQHVIRTIRALVMLHRKYQLTRSIVCSSMKKWTMFAYISYFICIFCKGSCNQEPIRREGNLEHTSSQQPTTINQGDQPGLRVSLKLRLLLS